MRVEAGLVETVFEEFGEEEEFWLRKARDFGKPRLYVSPHLVVSPDLSDEKTIKPLWFLRRPLPLNHTRVDMPVVVCGIPDSKLETMPPVRPHRRRVGSPYPNTLHLDRLPPSFSWKIGIYSRPPPIYVLYFSSPFLSPALCCAAAASLSRSSLILSSTTAISASTLRSFSSRIVSYSLSLRNVNGLYLEPRIPPLCSSDLVSDVFPAAAPKAFRSS